MRIAFLCLKDYHSSVFEEAAVAPVKLHSVKACGYDGQLPGVKLWNFMSVWSTALPEKKYEFSVNLGWINKGLKIACDNHTAQMVQFIIIA